jgi:hypothetical protein
MRLGSLAKGSAMASVTSIFGSVAVTVMMLSYALESRSKWFVLLFVAGSAATAIYSALVQAYPITAVEAVWAGIALRRFVLRRRAESRLSV